MRTLFRVLLTMILTATAAAGFAVPASAANPYRISEKERTGCIPNQVCVTARVVKWYGGYMSAEGSYSSRDRTARVVAVLYLCGSDGRCDHLVAANGQTVAPNVIVATSLKPISFGHRYRACASGPGLSNVCTEPLA